MSTIEVKTDINATDINTTDINVTDINATNINATNINGGLIALNVEAHPPPYSSEPVSPVIIQQPTTVVMQSIELGPNSFLMTCPQCHNTQATYIDYESNLRTHVTAAVLCLMGFWPCFYIPYCTPHCRDTKHNCSHCDGNKS